MDFSLRDISHVIRSGLDMPSKAFFSQHAFSMASLEKLLPLIKTLRLQKGKTCDVIFQVRIFS